MARVSPLLGRLNAGELSPRLEGRPDLDFYAAGFRICENMVPLPQGATTRRPGSRFVAEVKASANRTALIPFEFSTEQAYAIEVGGEYFRFYMNKGRIETSPGNAYEISTPYLQSDLFDAEGRLRLKFAQSADVIYLVHPLYPPHKLTRTGHTSWTLTEIDFIDGPYLDENPTTTTLTPSATTGNITIQASATTGINDGAGFAETDVGRLVRIGHQAQEWKASTAYSVGDIRRNGGRVYECTQAGTSGSSGGPSGTGTGIVDGSVTWKFLNEGGIQWGYAKITGVTSSTQVSATVKRAFGGTGASAAWRLGLWSETTGYPSAVTFHEQRLVFGGTRVRPQRWDASKIGDFETFTPGVLDVDPLAYSIDSNQVQAIRWFASAKDLLIGCASGEYRARGARDGATMTPTSIDVKQQTKHGCADMMPVESSAAVLFVQRQGRKLRELAYTIEVEGYRAPDLTVRSDHMATRSKPLIAIAYQQEPWSALWAVRKDGTLLSFTYQRDEQVMAWARHPIGGDGVVESVAVIPGAGLDQVWIVVRRTINGVTKRYVEVLEDPLEDDDDQEDAWYVDSGLAYEGPAATSTLSGLEHLEGAEVAIWTNRGVHPRRTVEDGAVTLDYEVTHAIVGLPITWKLKPMRLEGGAQAGTAQGRKKRVDQVVVRLQRSLGIKVGPSETELDEVAPRTAADNIGEAPALITGDREIPFNGRYDTDGTILLLGSDPTPVTIVAIIPRFATHEG